MPTDRNYEELDDDLQHHSELDAYARTGRKSAKESLMPKDSKELTRIKKDIEVQEEINKLLREQSDGLQERHELLVQQHQALNATLDAYKSKHLSLQLEHDELMDQHKALIEQHRKLTDQHRTTVKLLQLKSEKLDKIDALAKHWQSLVDCTPTQIVLRAAALEITAVIHPSRVKGD